MPYFIERDEWADDFIDRSPSMNHYGVKHKSGRYPYGSGEIPFQHEPWFTWGRNDLYNRVEQYVDHYRSQYGKRPSSTEIARAMGMTRTEFDPKYTNAKDRHKVQMRAFIHKCVNGTLPDPAWRGKKMSPYQIEKYTEKYGKFGRIPENTVKSLLNAERQARSKAVESTVNFLKQQISEKKMIDIGADSELYMPGGLSRTKFEAAIDILKEEGYPVYGRTIDQVTNPNSQNKTTVKVLCAPGTPKNILYTNLGDVKSLGDFHAETTENGETKFWKMEYPASLDSKRIKVIYGDEVSADGTTGKDRDGWIFLRRGCKDLDLKGSLYAQVRILVDGTHYIKGMASYYDGDMPDGVDVIINSNKPKGTPLKLDYKSDAQVLKPIKHDDPLNPFGALIKEGTGQYHYFDDNGEEKLGLINKKSEEGDWGDWKRTISSQFTSKQNKAFIKSQIDIALADKRYEFESIKQLENVVLKKQLLMRFASGCDSDAVDLRTGSLPGQSFQVLVPIPSLGNRECYAPQYENGTQVAVVRYPHADTSEIPILTVNNKNKEGLSLLGPYAKDCIGLNRHAEEQLSGADNDGDAAMVIPLRKDGPPITAHNPIPELEGFDPAVSYPYVPGVTKVMPESKKQIEMGKITNLIMDMDMKGADPSEKARAIKHSMVVIDAPKHGYDYLLSEEENGIQELINKYQKQYDAEGNLIKIGGASTLLTRAKSKRYIPRREGSPTVDPETGELVYKTARPEKLYWTDYKTGKQHPYQIQVPAMSQVSNAYELMTNPDPKKALPKEVLYADYANSLKALANEARKMAWYGLEDYEYSKEASYKYKDEVASLMNKINLSRRNRPRERYAQIQANARKEAAIAANPELQGKKTKEVKKQLKKIAQQAIMDTRSENNARRVEIDVTPEEWEAIRNHALDKTSLETIFKYANSKQIREYATPKVDSRALTKAQVNRIKTLAKGGWPKAEIAAKLGVSLSTVEKYVNGD